MSDTGGNALFDAIVAGRAAGDGRLLERADGRWLGDEEFLELTGRFAAALVEAGAAPGERVVVQVAKSVEAFALYVACLRAGAVFVPLNTAYTAAELGYFVDDAEPRVLVVDPGAEDAARGLCGDTPPRVLTLDDAGRGTLAEAAREAGADAVRAATPRAGDDLAAILYTSGTTGRAKGAMLTHANLLSNARTLVEAWRITADDLLVHALPIFHTHGLFVAGNTVLLAGARMRFLPRFDAERVLEALPRSTLLMGVPTFYTRLLAEERLDRERCGAMRLFVSGSAPLLAETHRAFEARTGHRILERYGMTETSMICSNPCDGERVAGTVGPPLPGVEIRLRDDEGRAVPRGEVGTLEVRGPNVFRGYWRRPEKTAEELGADGFFVTGDLATVDARGYVTIVGRGKDLIIAGGYNIYPKEVELAIDALPGVLESAVVGAPDADLGETVVAFVVRERGEAGSALDEAGIIDGVAPALARFKRPRRVVLVDALPRNAMGKVQKNALRERVAGG